ncbi:MAG TPA: T9SS type A sorting domain-containing protein [Paludibacter sp.]|nr:T9SS type A sorting domain-containing protein [Paludibacter sp.]
MKKLLLIVAVISVTFFTNAQTHLLTFESMYNTIITGIAASTEVATYVTVGAPKILLNQDRTSGIFTIVSPSTRTARMDSCNATFVGHSHNARIRLEPNGASNATNGRKIYIECPAPGTLTVGCWTTTAARGYTVENGTGTVLYSTNASMTAVTATTDLPVHVYNIVTAGRVVLNPNAGFYYGFVQFVENTNSVANVFSNNGLTFNGSQITNSNNLNVEVFNVLGKLVTSSTSDISTKDFTKGVYFVRAEGVKGAMKISV